MNQLLVLILLLLSTSAYATSQVNYLNVDGNAVHFSLVDSKSHTIPSCAVADTNQRYGVSLLTESGRAMYSMLITAMASKQAIDVKSANDCADVVGIERAEGVSISPMITEEQSNKVQWVGYTKSVAGHFAPNKSPFAEGSKVCAAQYPGSRLMLWNDYVVVRDSYPATQNIWFFDAIESKSTALGRYRSEYYLKSTLIYKNGQIKEFSVNSPHGEFYSKNFDQYISCDNWSNLSSDFSGNIMNTNEVFSVQTCNLGAKLACVK